MQLCDRASAASQHLLQPWRVSAVCSTSPLAAIAGHLQLSGVPVARGAVGAVAVLLPSPPLSSSLHFHYNLSEYGKIIHYTQPATNFIFGNHPLLYTVCVCRRYFTLLSICANEYKTTSWFVVMPGGGSEAVTRCTLDQWRQGRCGVKRRGRQ